MNSDEGLIRFNMHIQLVSVAKLVIRISPGRGGSESVLSKLVWILKFLH
jgi:hypothetical protein